MVLAAGHEGPRLDEVGGDMLRWPAALEGERAADFPLAAYASPDGQIGRLAYANCVRVDRRDRSLTELETRWHCLAGAVCALPGPESPVDPPPGPPRSYPQASCAPSCAVRGEGDDGGKPNLEMGSAVGPQVPSLRRGTQHRVE